MSTSVTHSLSILQIPPSIWINVSNKRLLLHLCRLRNREQRNITLLPVIVNRASTVTSVRQRLGIRIEHFRIGPDFRGEEELVLFSWIGSAWRFVD